MTDKARELLERCAFQLGNENMTYWNAGLVEEIRAYLAQAEVKRKPINNDRIIDGYYESKGGAWLMQPFRSFTAGVRFAEKHHGIGGGDE